ncbi:MAG: twin-arginine translocase subunit TatC [Bacteroidales bacterium]|nr:twin-arginine translocase subunit TatC [Bacteroidales bacterium]
MEQEEMSFWDHLEELRWTLFRSILALFIFTIAGFAVMPYLFDNVVMAPCRSDFVLYKYMCMISSRFTVLPDFCNENFHVDIINIKLASQFFTHMTSSFWFALLLTFPYLVFEVWRFISPALYENEKKNVRWVFLFGTIMFFVGCTLGYLMVFPLTLRFLATYELSSTIANQISLDSYMSNFTTLILIMGLVFELPLVSWLLSQLGLLNKRFFREYRRYAIVILLTAAAFITPSGDPFTLAVVFFPLYFLYELSAFFVKDAPKEENDDDTKEVATT